MTSVRLPQELVARIDKLRGLVPRERWVRAVLESGVLREEAAVASARLAADQKYAAETPLIPGQLELGSRSRRRRRKS